MIVVRLSYRKNFFFSDHEEISRTEGGNTNEDLESLRNTVATLEHNLNNCRQEIHDKEDRIKHLVRKKTLQLLEPT